MGRRREGLAALVLLATMPALAWAQSETPRIFVTAGAVIQLSHKSFTQDLTFSAYSEDGHLKGTFKAKNSKRYEFGGGVRVGQRMAVGATISLLQWDAPLHVDANVPHPFFFNQPRTASTDTTAHRSVQDVDFQVWFFLVDSASWQIAIGGGPSFSHVSQELATDVELTDVYPFDTVTLKSVTKTKLSGGRLGASIGASVTRMIGRSVGVTGDIRWSGASIVLKPEGGTIRIQTGGPQAGGSVRLLF
jgi:hypothetical protein